MTKFTSLAVMNCFYWLPLLLLISSSLKAQQFDFTNIDERHQVDSIRINFYKQADSIKQQFTNKWDVLNESKGGLSSGDPLQKTEEYKKELLLNLQQDIDSLKLLVPDQIKNKNISPSNSKYVAEISSELNNFKLPVGDIGIDGIDNLQLKDLDFSKDFDIPSLVPNRSPLLPGITENLPTMSHNIPTAQDLKSRAVTSILGKDQIQGIAEIIKKEVVDKDKITLPTPGNDPLEVMDHFSDKQEELNEAMKKVSELKKKYRSVNSLAEIPMLKRNPMHGKPFRERVLPQVLFQLQRKDHYWLVDWSNYFGWRFTDKLLTGAGWNHRFTYSNKEGIQKRNGVYGPRIYGEYKFGFGGFQPRIEAEVMHTLLPPFFTTTKHDQRNEQWLPALFIGLTKKYKFYGNVIGTYQVMFRIAGDKIKSPYDDVLNMRFGFEFPMKKKPKQNQN